MIKEVKDTVLDIDGFKLETDGVIYKVEPKYDPKAPDGYKRLRTTKILQRSAGRNTHTVAFDDKTKLWDTGLHERSAMYSGLSPERRKEIVSKVRELIVFPFKDAYGGEEMLDPTDIDSPFWNYQDSSSFKIDLYKGRIFDTSDPRDLLELFIAISSKVLCPKELEGSPIYKDAQFCIENKDKVRTLEQENDMLEMETLGKFYTIINDEKKLRLVMNYLNIPLPKGDLNDVKPLIISQFKRWTENKNNAYQNKKEFLQVAEKVEDKDGYKELSYYKELQQMFRKAIIKKEFENYLIDDTKIGTSLKEAAHNCIKDKAIEKKVIEYLS